VIPGRAVETPFSPSGVDPGRCAISRAMRRPRQPGQVRLDRHAPASTGGDVRRVFACRHEPNRSSAFARCNVWLASATEHVCRRIPSRHPRRSASRGIGNDAYSFGCYFECKQDQTVAKEQRAGDWDVWQTSLHNPDFAEELDIALEGAIEHDGPALVDVITDPELV
jgi:hypothetical protein